MVCGLLVGVVGWLSVLGSFVALPVEFGSPGVPSPDLPLNSDIFAHLWRPAPRITVEIERDAIAPIDRYRFVGGEPSSATPEVAAGP